MAWIRLFRYGCKITYSLASWRRLEAVSRRCRLRRLGRQPINTDGSTSAAGADAVADVVSSDQYRWRPLTPPPLSWSCGGQLLSPSTYSASIFGVWRRQWPTVWRRWCLPALWPRRRRHAFWRRRRRHAVWRRRRRHAVCRRLRRHASAWRRRRRWRRPAGPAFWRRRRRFLPALWRRQPSVLRRRRLPAIWQLRRRTSVWRRQRREPAVWRCGPPSARVINVAVASEEAAASALPPLLQAKCVRGVR